MSNPSRPLWKAVYVAGRRDGDDGSIHPWEARQIAAELRAIADWLVPEEPPHPDVFPSSPGNVVDIAMCSQRGQRQDIRAKLMAEADRAAAGAP